MWDNPRALNMAAGFLVGLVVLAITLVGALALLRSTVFPMREIVVTSGLVHTTRADIEAALAGRGAGNFFAASPAEVRAALEQLPWVRRVDVRRVWPDRLEVTLEEHVALARWGDDALINTHGERFAAATDQKLPLLIAPPGTEAEVARRYLRFANHVAPLGTTLERVVVTPRLAWQLRLANGLQLMLGRDGDAAEARLQRFVDLYALTLKGMNRHYEYVDLRYPNGFALRVPDFHPASRS